MPKPLVEQDRPESPSDIWSAIQAFRDSHDLSDLAVDEIYEDVRDTSRGRETDG